MQKIILKSLRLHCFKGIKDQEVNFGRTTTISGENATGKTTLFDAFLWLLFGKDSTDRSQFEIKTLNGYGQAVHKVDHEVTGTFEVDGETLVLKRVYREKWVKRKGAIETEMAGHEQEFFWNEVPKKESEYQAKVSDLVKEGLFKLLTNTSFFNSLPWEKRRSVLLDIAGEIGFDEVMGAMGSVAAKKVQAIIDSGKSFDDFKKETAFKKKRLKEELELIPARVDEVRRSIVDQDFTEIQDRLDLKKKELVGLESGIQNSAKVLADAQQEQRKIQTEIFHHQRIIDSRTHELRQGLEQRDREGRAEIEAMQAEVKRMMGLIGSKDQEINILEGTIQNYETKLKALRAEWSKINAETLEIDEHVLTCPTCKRLLDAADVVTKTNELTANFNSNKTARLKHNQAEGVTLKEIVVARQKELEGLKAVFEAQESKVAKMNERLQALMVAYTKPGPIEDRTMDAVSADAIIEQERASIAGLQEKIVEPKLDDSVAQLTERRRLLTESIDELKQALAQKDANDRSEIRLKDLIDQEEKLAQQLADLEGTEFAIASYEKAKMEILEARVNSRFTLVKFQLFDTQINGGEVPCCKTLVPGPGGSLVPYSDANTGGQINAGLDIIQTLSDHYGIQAPIWVDNAESVTAFQVKPRSQMIYLRAQEGQKKLKVEAVQAQEAALF